MTVKYYDPLSRALHWFMAIVIIYATFAGYYMHVVVDRDPPLFNFLSILNMSMATLITPLFLLRWGWRYFRPKVVEEANPHHQLAHLAHSLLYILMAIVLLSGFLMLDKGYMLFWFYFVPNPISSAEINAFFFSVHRAGCMSLGALVILHAAAALYHHFGRRNRMLYRMLGPLTLR